jgi:hypothetical protein
MSSFRLLRLRCHSTATETETETGEVEKEVEKEVVARNRRSARRLPRCLRKCRTRERFVRVTRQITVMTTMKVRVVVIIWREVEYIEIARKVMVR